MIEIEENTLPQPAGDNDTDKPDKRVNELPRYREVKQKAYDKLERFSATHLRKIVFLQICSFCAFALMLTVEWVSDIRAEQAQWIIDLSLMGKDVLYYDELLSTSSRLYVLTLDINYRDTYFMSLPSLDAALLGIRNRAPEIVAEFERLTVEANDALVEAETSSFDLTFQAADNATASPAAVALLFGADYTSNKAQFTRGLETLEGSIEERRQNNADVQEWWGVLSVVIVLLAVLAEVGTAGGLTYLDSRLKTLSEKAQAAEESYEARAKDTVLKSMARAARAARGGGSESYPLVPGISQGSVESKEALAKKRAAKQLIRRLRMVGAVIDFLGVLAVGIPSVLTIVALVNANGTRDLESIVLHMRLIQYYDLALTSSAQMCALNGNSSWATRYDGFVAPFDAELAALQELKPDLVTNFVDTTSAANTILLRLEGIALENCVSNRSLAKATLFSEQYRSEKAKLLDGISDMREKVDTLKKEHEDSEKSFDLVSRVLMIVCTLVVVGTDLARVLLTNRMESIAQQHQKAAVDDVDDFLLSIARLFPEQGT